jgi:acyl-[acyl-carrier-protein]-phospholipid O-acyltransferase/long-chain-fatty-acid--[acyl-carrier-protein] ligase
MTKLIDLFKTLRFTPLFITQFFGAFNDNAFKNALLIWFTYVAAEESNISAPIMVTLAAGVFILPFFLFSATAGQLADKIEKSSLVRKIKIVEIILMVLCGIGFYLKSVPMLLTILFFMGIQSTFFGPIKYSLLPEHLNKDELIPGNALIEGGTFLAILLGTIFGGIVVMLNHGVVLLTVAVILFAIIGCVGGCYIPKTQTYNPDLKIGLNIFHAIWKIIQYARVEKIVWLAILGISWMWFVGAMFLMQFPTYTKGVIVGDERIVTLFLTLFSLGIGVGSVLCNRLLKGQINGRLVPLGAIGMTVCILVFCFASYYYGQKYTPQLNTYDDMISVMQFFDVGLCSWLIVASLFCLSVSTGIFIVPLYAIMQYRSDHRYISRIIAANNIMNSFFMVCASLMSMALFAFGMNVIDILLSVGILSIPFYFMVKKIVKVRLAYAK